MRDKQYGSGFGRCNANVCKRHKNKQLYQVVVKYYHIFSNNTGKHCIFAINQHKGKWHSIDDFTNAILFIASRIAGSSCC